ncbi:MAG: translation initiation factor IF-1 [Candidatus Doudnabacteria bacterium]|nr:translation initiation factor IF-1 [Candidatus Doudnabacteria bacterium]MCA9387591.1 translation initiation factor IF-1 [Candidatus Andersenbacteria bacterium]
MGQRSGPRKKKKKNSGDAQVAAPKRRDVIEMDGTITQVLPNSSCKVKLVNDHEVLATLSGKMKMYRISVLPGDRVTVEFTPYDLTKGRITRRHG